MIARRNETGFALPTILIVSVVMMIVMLAGVQSVVNINVALRNQYYTRLARQAALSGIVKAQECIRVNGSVGWTSAADRMLRPNTECTGGAACTGTSSCYILNQTNIKTTFEIGAPTILSNGSYNITATSKVQLIRTTNSTVWKTFTGDARAIVAPPTTSTTIFSSMAGGQSGLCGLSVTGSVYCLGTNGNYMLGTGDNALFGTATFKQLQGDLTGKVVSQIAINAIHGCAISDGKVYCWGGQQNGALGTNVSGNALVPTAVYTGGVLAGKTMTTVMTAGTGGLLGGLTVYAHTCALDSAGNAYCWGANGNTTLGGGQIGNGVVGGGDSPVPVAVVGGLQFKQGEIVGGSWHTCAIRTNGKLYCWGADNNGQIGNGGTGGSTVTHTGTPTQVQGSSILDLEYAGQSFTDIAAGKAHNCAISTEYKMYCWGQGNTGALGQGDTNGSQFAVKVPNPGDGSGGWSKVAAGTYWTCALSKAGHAYCWGGPSISGSAPYIGDGSTSGSYRTTPTAVVTSGVLSGKTLTNIWCTDSTVIVRDTNGVYYSWGANQAGTLGTGSNSTPDTASPILATHLNTFGVATGNGTSVPF